MHGVRADPGASEHTRLHTGGRRTHLSGGTRLDVRGHDGCCTPKPGLHLLGHLGHPGYPYRHRPQAHGQFTSRVVPVPIPTKCLAPHIAVTAQGGDGPGRRSLLPLAQRLASAGLLPGRRIPKRLGSRPPLAGHRSSGMIFSRRIPPVPLAGCFVSLEGYAFLSIGVTQFPQLLILAPHMDGQTLPGILIHHCQETNGFAVTGAKGHKVVCPDVVPSLWPQPHAGAVSKPESTTLGLFGWYFESSPSPDSLHPLVVHSPSLPSQRASCMTRCLFTRRSRCCRRHHENWPRVWRSPQPKGEYDVVIVGAGGHGLATA